ncbi:GNAT family N-acetyltransferase [Brevundimonas sp.]|jgi:predicted GNAT family acetyltransferase|uniref:GNAT family N-acetyltransferase n=1 Tax=Brevundimonas sp. TaxID=1871086 RepID=UPI0037844738
MTLDHPLDRPTWNALISRLAGFAIGDARAVRLDPACGVFLAAADDGPEARAAMTELARLYPGSGIVERAGGPMDGVLPDGAEVVGGYPCVQMVCSALTAGGGATMDAEPLGEAHAPEMLALATLTQPGPFRERTHALGGFFGVRRDGRLIAMAGRRMRVPGFSELSAVCVHPDHRGQGLAGALSRIVVSDILAEGDHAFLHAKAEAATTIRLYESLGFSVRIPVSYTVLA